MAAKKNQVSDPCRMAAADKFQRWSPDADAAADDAVAVGFGIGPGFIGLLPASQKASELSVPLAANSRQP
jgi:hypothetical protein